MLLQKIFEVLETNLHIRSLPQVWLFHPCIASSFAFQTWLDFFLPQFSRSMQIVKVIKYFLQRSMRRIYIEQKQEKTNKGCLGSQRKDFEGMTLGTFAGDGWLATDPTSYCHVGTEAQHHQAFHFLKRSQKPGPYIDCFDF